MLVDTSVVVDVDRGAATERIARLDDAGRHAISVVTLTELRLGVNKRHDPGAGRDDARSGLDRLLARFDVVGVDRAVGTAAADLIDELSRAGAPLHDLHDVYIGATARTEQLPVLTANVSHFERMDGVRVVDWTDY